MILVKRCGRLVGNGFGLSKGSSRKQSSSSRIVNSEIAKKWYPWATYIIRFRPQWQNIDRKNAPDHENEMYKIHGGGATGAVISRR